MSSAKFIKSALALILTVGFAGGAVYYGTNAGNGMGNENGGAFSFLKLKNNEISVSVPQKSVEPKPVAQKQPAAKKVAKEIDAKKTAAKTVVKPKTKSIGITQIPQTPQTLDLKRIMPMLMVQAGRIENTEIKDQAYLDIVSFSVSQRQFYFADAAMEKIDQAELRDTARSQIAIALALDGKADEAFEVIDAVEIDALRDVMRLQVIEALILPQKLPSGLR